MLWVPQFTRDEVIQRAISKIGEPGATADNWDGPGLNCLQFVAWAYGYPLADMRGYIGEVDAMWEHIKQATGWAETDDMSLLRPADMLGVRFRYMWHVGICVNDKYFVHVAGKVAMSKIKYWARHGVKILRFPE